MRRRRGGPLLLCAAALLVAGPASPSARARDLADFIPDLWGGKQAIRLRQISGPPHDPLFLAPQLGDLLAVNQALAELPATLPVGSSAAGFTYELDPETGVPRRTASEGLGPLFAERARTVGQNRFDATVLYSHVTLERFQGDSLASLGFVAPLAPVPGGNFSFQNNVLDVSVNIHAQEEITSFFFTYGITEWLDANAVVPLVYLHLSVRGHADLAGKNGQPPAPVHTFQGGPDPQDDGGAGSAFGVGDVLLRAKWRFLDTFFGPKPPLGDKMELAVEPSVKLPTGDEKELLGTGRTDFRITGIASKTFAGFFEPHLNLGYEWSGTAASEDAYRYAVGIGLKLADPLTVFGDVIGRHKRLSTGIGDDIVDWSIGAKWNPWRNLILSGNVLLPLNTEGLRPEFLPSFAVEYIW